MIICPNLSNKEVAQEFDELKSALMAADPKHGEAMAYLVWSLNNGNAIDKAPNGAESLLFKSLVDYYEGDRSKAIVAKAKTYSTNFLKWFGNWTGEEDALPEIRKQNPYSSEITIGKASPDYDSADVNGAGAMFAIRKNGEYIGSIAVNAYYRKGGNIEPWGEKDTNYVSMSSVGDAVEIEKEFRGKGYGKAAYFEFAKLMADLGYILRSAPSKSRTPASTRVWESLVRDGYAKRVGDRYEFINWFGDQGRFKTTDTKNNLFTPSGEVNWDYFELLLDLYHNNQPDSMFSHGRYTLATRPENHFTGEKNTLNHIKFVTQSMLNLLEGKYDMDLPFVSEARSSLQNQKDLMILAAMFHDVAKPYRHGDIHGWESADILRDLLGVDYNNRVAEWAVRHHMPMPFSHKAEFSLSNPEAIEVAKNIARDARRVGIDANTAINAFVLINAADVINGRELNVDDNWAKKTGEEGLKKYNGDISVKNVLSVELKEKVALLKKAFDEIKDEDFGDTVYNYSHQERFDYQAFPEGGREDKKLPYLNNTEYTGVSKVVDENGEPLVVWHGSRISNNIEEFQNDNTFFADRYTAFSYTPFDAEDEREYMYPSFLSIKNPKNVDAKGNVWNDIDGKSTDDIVKELSENDGAIIVNLKDYSDFTPGNPELSESILEEAPLHTDYITLSRDQIKHIDNRDGEYTGPNIYHNIRGVDSSNEVREELLFSGAIKKSFNGGYELVNQPWAIQQVRDVCKQYGMLASTFVTPSGKIKISFVTHEGSLPKISADKIPQSVRLDPTASTIEELTKEGHAISELVSFLKEKFPQLEVEYIFPSQLNEKRFEGIDKNTNSFVKGNRVYLIRGRVTSEIAAEELLHPLVYTIANQNWGLFQDFITEAKRQFPKLASQIEDNYTNARGFNEFNRQLELVTQVLARHVNKKFNAGEKGSKLSKLIDQMFNYIGSTIRQFINKFRGNDNDFNDIRKMTLSELADIILAEDSTFKVYTTEEIQHNLSNRLQAAQDEANRIIVRMNVLYKQYEKMKSKTPSQERLANQIFETLNKLKQHRDISAVQIALDQARLTLGQYDPTTGGPAQISSIYKYLHDAMLNGFTGVSAQSLVDMYRNSIKFYKDLIENIPSEQAIDLTRDDKNAIADLKSLIDDHIMPIWTQAIMQVGDQIVDDQIDNEVFSSDENKEDMKKVAKDWLHKNLMYGDITAVTSYVYNYSNSSNPIIKLAFHLIQQAELKTLEEVHQIAPKLMRAYQRANKGSRSFTPGWQSMMMEYDDNGIPTGNFVRELNYGLYQKDLKEFLEDLNKRFVDTYGFTYVVDDTGAVTNSLTGEFAEDEEWGPNGEMPRYIEYLREIEYFKADRVHRRYQPRYYLERLSRPYDGTIDPMDPKFTGTKFNHGLSPKTLARYTYYQSNINYYLNKCQDPDTGLIYPERLSYDDQLSLDRWRERMDKFTSIFNDDGSYKIGEDLKMAYEVRAWLKWIGEFTDSDVFQDQFNTELLNIKNESVSTSNPRLYNDFVKYNSHVGINPDFIKQTVGDMRSAKSDTDTSFRGKLLRSSLQGMVNNPHIFGRELQKMINNPLFWLLCKTSDQAIEDANDPDNVSGWDKAQVLAFQENFYQKDILYIDEYGFYIDENGNKVNPADPSAKVLEDAGKLLTFRSYLINRYTDEALRTGQVSGLIDESTGMPIDFSGLTQSQIRNQIHSLLSYKKTYWDEDGNIDRIEDEPLTIFSVLAPVKDKFFNKRTGRNEPTVILVGDSRFKDSHSSLQTSSDKYDPNSGIAEVPNKDYADGRYDNSEAYNKVMKDDSVKELYELLIQAMLDMQSIYSTNRKFNYKVPQINARTSALLSRLLKRGYSVKSIQGLWNSMTSIEENDELLRTKQDYFVGVDGHVANDVPLKFIRDLKNKEDLSTDLVSTVIMFADMALNYKNKSEIDSKLKILRYNMDKDIRDVYESKIKSKSEQSAKNNDNSTLMFDSMMDVSMYGNKFGNTDEGGPGKVRVALHKTADAFQSLESSAMLGLNMFSMSVGFADSITRIFSESVAGKYMTPGDCLWALGKVLWYTPACIWNMFNPVANNKMTALMQMNGISKGTFGIYTKADWGKGRKFLSNLLMGGWSMLDWMANALLMMAFYHNCRLYEGTEIPKGFYTKYEMEQAFLKIGKTKSEARKAFHNYTHIGSRITLWDAYGFKNGQAFVKPEYEAYVTLRVKTNVATKTKKRGALYNGMNPDNDIPRWKRDVIGRLAGALRGWIVQQFQHLAAGGTDSVARDFTTEEVIETNSSGTRKKTRMVKNKLTDEQRSRRMAWDYETGTPQDQILIGLWRSFKTVYREATQMLFFKPRTAKLSEVEKYAWKDAVIFLSMLAMMMVGWTYVHDDAREVKKPKSRKEAGPASMWNPADYYEYVRDVYIPNQYWKLAIDDIYFRTVEAKISNINPQQVLDIVSALTALKSGLDDQLGVIGLGMDVINGENTDEVLKQGAYKFYTKGERSLYRAVGPAKNLHTFLTYYGATNNLRWYTNKFGTFYRAFGYDFKAKDKESSKNQQQGFQSGNFSSGGFSSGSFSSGGF